jgi:hypothetical protein
MVAAGRTANPGDAAHHIVPSTHRLGDQARTALNRAGMGVNDAANGVFVSQALHAPLHTTRYMQEVERRILQAYGSASTRAGRRAAITQALDDISKLILKGKFP